MREFRPPVRPSKLRWILVAVAVLGGVVPAAALGPLVLSTAAISYAIAGGALTVKTGDLFGGDRTARLADITEARPLLLQRGRRTAGTALPGYCVGRFSYDDLGPVWQATDCGARAVVVRVAGQERPIVLTPPDREDFVGRLRSGAETSITLPAPDRSVLWILAAVVIPIGLAVAILVTAMILLGPSRMRYLVGEGALEVRTIFGRKRWPLSGARARPHTPVRLLRVAGAAAPGYFTGIFREDGQTTRVYATDRERTVLIEGPARVIVSPEDREGFLRALADEGAKIDA